MLLDGSNMVISPILSKCKASSSESLSLYIYTNILIYLVDAKKFYKREILGFAICGPKDYFENWVYIMERIYVYTIGAQRSYTICFVVIRAGRSGIQLYGP